MILHEEDEFLYQAELEVRVNTLSTTRLIKLSPY